MRLGTKIIIGFFCISLLLAAVGFVSNQFSETIRDEQNRYVNEGSEVVINSSEMERSLYQSLIFLNAIRETNQAEFQDIGVIQELPSKPALKEKFEEELNRFDGAFSRVQNSYTYDDTAGDSELQELEGNVEVYKALSREWLELGPENYEQANLMFITSIEPYFRNNIIPNVSTVRSNALEVQQDRIQSLEATLERASLANVIATLFSILLSILLAVYIYRSIANPLLRLNKATRKIGEGNLDERVDIETGDEIGELAGTINQMAENLQNKTVSKEFLDNIVGSIHEALFVADAHGKLTITNSAAGRMLGYSEEEFRGSSVSDYFDPECELSVIENLPDNEQSAEFRLVSKSGKIIPVLFSRADLYNTEGKKVGTVSVASDITERKSQEEQIKESLKEKEVLLAEIHHRVKNNLAVISGLMQLQAYSEDNEVVKKALNTSQLRIQSIALVHEMLYQSDSLAYIDYNIYINDLLQAISSMHLNSGKDIELRSEVDPISISVNQAIPSSLLLNELIVNSYKHAFPDRQEGYILVEMEENDDKVITMSVSDNGIGFDTGIFENSDSLGMSLIKTLSKQLDGELEFSKPDEGSGSKVTVVFTKED